MGYFFQGKKRQPSSKRLVFFLSSVFLDCICVCRLCIHSTLLPSDIQMWRRAPLLQLPFVPQGVVAKTESRIAFPRQGVICELNIGLLLQCATQVKFHSCSKVGYQKLSGQRCFLLAIMLDTPNRLFYTLNWYKFSNTVLACMFFCKVEPVKIPAIVFAQSILFLAMLF
jgi:hypothetical protein